MEESKLRKPLSERPGWLLALLCLCAVAVNLLGWGVSSSLKLPLYLDSLGTLLAAALGGPLPGIAAGLVTGLAEGLFQANLAYYGAVHVLFGLVAAGFARRNSFDKPQKLIAPIFCLALIGGGLGSILSWLLSGFEFGSRVSAPLAHRYYDNGSLPLFWAQFSADMLVDLADKLLVCVLCFSCLHFLPDALKELFRSLDLRQHRLPEELRRLAKQRQVTAISLRDKILFMVGTAAVLTAIFSIASCVLLYHRGTIQEHTKLGQGVASLVASTIDPERVEDYLARGEAAEGYAETEQRLYSIRDSSPSIEYVYVYQIREDGCHVVFDLDTEDLAGAEPGEIVPFDESFAPYLPALMAGESIEPLITNDTYGWLLTVYHPVYDAAGRCCCYAAADISMGELTTQEIQFVTKVLALFIGALMLILALGFWIAETDLIEPINTMALSAGAFAYDSEAARAENVQRLKALDIHTGDEIENLYRALVKTTEDTMRYIGDVHEKSDTINKMQSGLILVLADMVESRDKCTGDHIRKTAAYTAIIMEQMRRDGVHTAELTDEFVSNVVNAAPLHDIGKIQVPDALLNKPGKLTEEEFELMKVHTTAGGEIISRAIELVPNAGYLTVARDLALYHHERWNGRGYPKGLAGEEIPLSARIMAVADVFDALVSARSYKPPFRFETAMNIIRESGGSHFDPEVAEAFLRAEDEVRRVADGFSESSRSPDTAPAPQRDREGMDRPSRET